MDYALELQIIIEALKADKRLHRKWSNKFVARLEELVAMSDELYPEGYQAEIESLTNSDAELSPKDLNQDLPPEFQSLSKHLTPSE